MQTFLTDLKYGLRLLARSPGFALTAILALALGIGANTAIFSAVDAVLLRPLPYREADRIVMVWEDGTKFGYPRNTPAPANYLDWARQNTVFQSMAATRSRSFNLIGDGNPEQLLARSATTAFFGVMGAQPVLGRSWTAEEDEKNIRVAVISYGLWQRRFGGERSVVGQSVNLSGEKFTVIGVMPRGFAFPDRQVDLWLPASFPPSDLAKRGSHFLNVIARLKPGISAERAQTEMTGIATRLEREYPNTNTGVGAIVVPLKDQIVGDTRIALLILLAAAGCVLCIACSNVANLLLSRATARQREIAVRMAIGAGRNRLIRQLITESLLISLLGGALGLAIAYGGLEILDALIPTGFAATKLSLDLRVLLFTLGVSVLSGVAFGVFPALQSSRLSLHDALKQGGRSGVGGRSHVFRNGLVITEVALALVLLVSAGLMIQTLVRLQSVDLGFQPDHLMTFRTTLPLLKYKTDADLRGYYARVLERVRAMPGVKAAGFASNLPFTARGNSNGFQIEGQPEPPPGTPTDALYREVTAGYLETIGARLRAGRTIADSDRGNAPYVLVINQFFEKRWFPKGGALGNRISFGRSKDGIIWYTIAGIVEDMKERGVDMDMKPAVYVPVEQSQMPQASYLAVRTVNDPTSVVNAVRQAIWAVDREQPIAAVRTMEEIIDLDFASRKQQMLLLAGFAGLALVLASLGIYGVLSYAVTQRTREIGVRMALGASTSSVARMVVRFGLGLTVSGLLIGIALALAATRAMRAVLFGVQSTDAGTYAGVVAVLLTVAFFACYIPARRAASVDPMVALRDE